MEEHQLEPIDLPELGSFELVLEILNGKQDLTVTHIRTLAERFQVSPAVFSMRPIPRMRAPNGNPIFPAQSIIYTFIMDRLTRVFLEMETEPFSLIPREVLLLQAIRLSELENHKRLSGVLFTHHHRDSTAGFPDTR